nr:unnamed protein product [Callosobruchus chinensis]
MLHYFGFSDTAESLMRSYFENRQQQVVLNNEYSSSLELIMGVPQGSIVGPLMFIVYTSNLYTSLRHCKVQYYADDTQIYLSFPPDQVLSACKLINKDLESLVKASRNICLDLNPTKSEVMLFGPKKWRDKCEPMVKVELNKNKLGISPVSQVMEWSNETVFEFLECYENEPVIWNASLPTHKNRNDIYDAWKRIEVKMGHKYTVTELKKKKDSLMASFRACLNKVKQSLKSGAGTDEIYKPPWFAYEKMATFLRDKDLPRQTRNTDEVFPEEDGNNNDEEEAIATVNMETERPERVNVENDALVLPSTNKSTFKAPVRKKSKVAEAQDIKDKMDNAYSLLKTVTNKSAKEQNVCSIYGELIAAKLQEMDEHTREICMHRIDNILFEIKMNSRTSHAGVNSTNQLNILCTHDYKQSSPSPSSNHTQEALSLQNVTQNDDMNHHYQTQNLSRLSSPSPSSTVSQYTQSPSNQAAFCSSQKTIPPQNHYGGVQLQEVAYNLPGAIVDYDEEEDNDVFQNLVDKLSEYFSPKQNSDSERYVFRSPKPEEGENFNKFLLRTRQQARKCSFGSTAQKATEIHIKDKLIDSWAPLELKRKLLEKERSLDEIVEICQIHEQTGGQSKAMSTSIPSVSNASVNKIRVQPKNNKHQECTRCGKQGHTAFAPDYPARDSDVSENDAKDGSMREYCFKIIDSDDDENKDELITCKVGGIDMKLLIDSGSKVNILKKHDWELLSNNKATVWEVNEKPNKTLKGYASGKALDIKHRFQTTIRKETAKQLGILKLELHISTIEEETPFPKIKNIVIKLTIDSTVKPVRQPVRRVPISLEESVEAKLENALKTDIIERVLEPSQWISPIVIIFKPNEDIRICVDMRRANEAILRENYPLFTFESFITKLRNAKYFSRLDLTSACHQLELHEESRPITTFITHKGMFRYKRVMFGSGKSNIADPLSRLGPEDQSRPFDRETENHACSIVEQVVPKAMSISQIVTASREDKQIADAVTIINNNTWEPRDENILYPFRLELSAMGPVILRGNKIHVLLLAHEGHPGATVTKRRLRAKVWWPLIDRQVEKWVKTCRECLLVAQPDRPPAMVRHKLPEGPWQCLAIHLLGPLPNNEYVLAVIDYYSRYQECEFLKNVTSNIIIKHLSKMFARLGLPTSIRTDNGSQFTSEEFKSFCDMHNINIINTPPYWPQANGEVENLNRSLVKRSKISHSSRGDYHEALFKYTMMYNTTPHGTTATDSTYNNIDGEAQDNDVLNKQKGEEKEDKARQAKENDIKVGDVVVTKNMTHPHKPIQ